MERALLFAKQLLDDNKFIFLDIGYYVLLACVAAYLVDAEYFFGIEISQSRIEIGANYYMSYLRKCNLSIPPIYILHTNIAELNLLENYTMIYWFDVGFTIEDKCRVLKLLNSSNSVKVLVCTSKNLKTGKAYHPRLGNNFEKHETTIRGRQVGRSSHQIYFYANKKQLQSSKILFNSALKHIPKWVTYDLKKQHILHN